MNLEGLMARRTAPPPQLGQRGRQLWAACLSRDDALTDDANPYRRILLDACRTAELLDSLDALVGDQGVMIAKGRPHPLLAETNRMRALLPRLLAALRMPDTHGRRPQRRGSRFERLSPSKR